MLRENKENAEVDMDMGSKGEKGASQAQGNALVDRFVKKDFGEQGEFIGKVISYDSSSGFYLVFYEDEDKEDFELDELTEILIPEVEVTDEMNKKFERLKRKIFIQTQKRDTCKRVASPGMSSGPPKRSRRGKSSGNEIATLEPPKRARREKSKVNEGVSTGPTKRAGREMSNINEVAAELPKKARREKSKVNEVANSEPSNRGREEKAKVNLEVVGDSMKSESKVNPEVVSESMKSAPEEGAGNVDGKIRVGENWKGVEVGKDTKVPDSVDSKTKNEPKEDECNVDGKIGVAGNSEGTEVGNNTKVPDSVAIDSKNKTEPREDAEEDECSVDGKIGVAGNSEGTEVGNNIKVPDSVAVDSKNKTESKEGAEEDECNVDGKIWVAGNSEGTEVGNNTKVPHSVAVDSKNKTEPKEGADNVDGKIRVAGNSEGAEVGEHTKVPDSVAVDSESKTGEGADNVDAEIRVGGISGCAVVEKGTKVSDSVAVYSKSRTEPKEGADNVDGKIRVGEISGGSVVEKGTKVPHTVAVDSKSKTEPKEGAYNVDGKIRVGEILGGAEVEKGTKVPENNVVVDSKSKTDRRGSKRKTNIDAAASMAFESSMTVSCREESMKSQRQKRHKVSQNGVNLIKLDDNEAKELTAPVNSEMLTPSRRRGRPKKNDGVTQNSQKCSAQKEFSITTLPRKPGRPKKEGVTPIFQKCSAQKELSSTAHMGTQKRRPGRPKNDEGTQNSQKCSAQKESSCTTQRRRKRMRKKSANGLGWSGSDDGNNSLDLEEESFTVGNEEVSLDVDGNGEVSLDVDDNEEVSLDVDVNEEVSLDVDASDCNDVGQVELSRAIEDQLPPMQPLPQSSEDIILPDSAVPDLLSVYTFLRASSDLLFLSPFTLEDFLGALHFRTMNSLLDSVHVSLLRALRRHLEMLLTEGNNRASKCLRQLEWNFLDAVTWPSYLAVYLLTQHGSETLGQKNVNLNILDGEYYRILASTKLTILQLLCDDIMETEEFRTKVNMLIDFEHDIDDDEKMNMFSTQNAFNGSNPCHNKSKQISSSKGDVQKSSHEIINYISDNSTLQNEQGNSSKGEAEFTTGAMNDTEDFNIDECRLCGMDGGLLCCDSCPSAYHSRCVGMLKAHIPQGPWYCLECVVKKSDVVGLKALETLSGAEIFGIDPYGRVFFGACGYLLVADFSSNPTVVYRYYNKCDAKNIVEFLGICGPFYSEIRSAILQYWGISDSKNDSTCIQNSETISGTCPTQLSYLSLAEHLVMQDEASRSGLSSGSVEGKSEKANCAHVPECLVNPNNANLTKETEIAFEGDGQLFVTGISNGKENDITSTKGFPGGGPNTLMDVNVNKIDLDRTSRLSEQVQPKIVFISKKEQVGMNVNEGRGSHADVCDSNLPKKIEQSSDVGKTTDKVDSKTSFWGSRTSFQPDAYKNHYALGDTAASAAAMLASMAAENNTLANTRGVPKRTLAVTLQEQIKAISKVSVQFYWPSYNKKAAEPPRERCGWCISCKSTTTYRRACLLNVAASNVMGGAANVLGGIRPIKNGEGHLPAVAAYILYIEDCLHGLVVGPWENWSYRKHWRKCVEQASTIKEISTSLLELERNIRLIALAPGWTKHVEYPTSFVSTIHPPTSVTTPAPRRGRRSHKSIVSSVTVPASNNFQKTTFRWWRGGRLHNQVFQEGILPCATVKRTGRQGGLKRIAGVLYAEGSDIPIKSRQYIWRTAVEMATSLSQLAVQVRYLDAHVKWKDLEFQENQSQDVRAAGKVAAPFPDAAICDKKHEGGDFQYLLDFGNQRDIPIYVVKYGTRVEGTQEGNNKYWLGEFHVPLYLLKAFEEQLVQACQPNGYKHVMKNQNGVVHRSRKKHGFSVLFSEAEMNEKSSCVHCSGDVSIRKSVKCTSCAGSFHPECTIKSETSDNYECHFTCYKCYNTKLVERRDNFNHKIINIESKKNVGNKLVEIERSSLQPFGASTVLQDHLGIALNPPRRRRSNRSGNQNGPVWNRTGNDELGREFRENYLLLACDIENDVGASDGPMCLLCSQAYNPRLLYVGCTACRAWFHGEAFGLNQENIADLIGFKCHKCRKKGRPECPYETMDSKVRREKLPVRRQPKVNRGEIHGLNVTDGKSLEIMQSNSGEALNGLWTVTDDEDKHFAITSEPETDFYHSSEGPPSNLNQPSESKIFQHLELRFQHLEVSTVGTEASSPPVEWNFPVMDWSQGDQEIETKGGNLNPVEAYHQSEPLFTFTELLAGDLDQVEDLTNVSKGVVDNWTDILPTGEEIIMDSQTNGVESRECLSGYVMPSKTSDSQHGDKHDILTGFQLYGTANSVVLDETQVPSMENPARSGEMLSECNVCGIADLLPHYQCNVCRVTIHHHCYQVQQIGFWCTSGWICNSCQGGF